MPLTLPQITRITRRYQAGIYSHDRAVRELVAIGHTPDEARAILTEFHPRYES